MQMGEEQFNEAEYQADLRRYPRRPVKGATLVARTQGWTQLDQRADLRTIVALHAYFSLRRAIGYAHMPSSLSLQISRTSISNNGRGVAQVPNEEPQRIARVLDAKYRTIGIDKDALDQQVADRKAAEEAAKNRDRAFDQLSNYYADQVSLQQQQADSTRRQNNKEYEDFRNQNQLKHTRREWDINRPDGKHIDGPARVGDDDGRVGPSSMQKFHGEDLSAGDRKAAQLEQARNWWEEQAAQKAAQKAAEKESDMAYAELTKYHDYLQQDAKAQETSLRRDMNKATLDINMKLAEERKRREAQERNSNLASNMAEQDAVFNSPLMTEDPALAASSQSAYRVRKDHYKGMSEAEKQAILDTQLAQMEENKARKAAKDLEEQMFSKLQVDVNRAMNEQARRVDDFKKIQMDRASEVLKKQMAEKEARDKGQNDLYRNKIAPDYFTQFGTSHR
eukprot:gene13944-19880_t